MQARRDTRIFYLLVGLGALVVAAGLVAAHYMEEYGHIVTGMNNQIVWGMPHVFAIFMIVAASGVLNVASIGSVFGKPPYKTRAPLSGLLSIALLAGGLSVLMLDLGRPERIIVAATHFNPTSVFAWNVFLYSGLFAFVGIYLWTMMEKRMNPWSRPAGLLVFVWRIILTTGTGMIFALLVARQAYGTAILPPMFIVMSFAWGLAVFYIVQAAMYGWNEMELNPAILKRLKNLLGLFILSVIYLVAVYHVTNFARHAAFERFILAEGGIYPMLFWGGYVFLGSVLPLFLIYFPRLGGKHHVLVASMLVISGSFCLLYVLIIGGQAFPLSIFPGYEARSSFGDGQIGSYAPSLPEILLGCGGLGVSFLITTIGVRALNFMPRDENTQAGD
ncbi:MAG: polysulfide reductase NrfD [Burkholderiales bacterium]|nr:polysulfide reductase NrfD [Burkholderiales bacterium]